MMFHLLINFSVITFICYAVAGSAKAILFGKKQPAKRPARSANRAAKRSATPPRLRAETAKTPKNIITLQHKKTARKKLRAA